MGVAALHIDSVATVTLSGSMVIPVLDTAPTLTGFTPLAGPAAAIVTLSDLKTFFEGGTASEFVSTTAIATPSAFTVTTFAGFASTVSGAVLMGYGTTTDVTLMNRAGTPVLGVTANTQGLTLGSAGAAHTITGTTVASATDVASGAITFNANIGRGTGAVGGFVFAVPVTTSTGTTAQTLTNALVVKATTVPMVYAAGADATAVGIFVQTTQGFYSQVNLGVVRVGNPSIISGIRVEGSLAAPTIIGNAAALATVDFRGALTAATTATGARIQAITTEAWVASTASGTKLVFLVTPNTTTGSVTALTLDHDKSATFAANVVFTTLLASSTALATPSALAATALNHFASTVSGAATMGFGTTNDVSLMNRAGTVCLGVGPNTTVINIPGSLVLTGAATLNGATTITTDGGLLFTNGTDRAGANVGTLTNSPHTGNPAHWGTVSWNGTQYCVPLFALT